MSVRIKRKHRSLCTFLHWSKSDCVTELLVHMLSLHTTADENKYFMDSFHKVRMGVDIGVCYLVLSWLMIFELVALMYLLALDQSRLDLLWVLLLLYDICQYIIFVLLLSILLREAHFMYLYWLSGIELAATSRRLSHPKKQLVFTPKKFIKDGPIMPACVFVPILFAILVL